MLIRGEYQELLVMFSILIAIFGSYTALDLAENALKNKKDKLLWSSAAAISLGVGIWTMHFIGMIGYNVPFKIEYDAGKTFLSLLIAVVASFIGFIFMTVKRAGVIGYALAGILFGAGISGMHYVGMSAVMSQASMVYDNKLLVLSILISIGCAFLASFLMSIRVKHENMSFLSKFLCSSLLGFGISGMHYTGMAAMSFQTDMISMMGHNHDNSEQYTILAVLIGIMTIFIFVIFLAGVAKTKLDEQHKIKIQEQRYQYLLDHTPNIVAVVNQNGEMRRMNEVWRDIFGYSINDSKKEFLSYFNVEKYPDIPVLLQRSFAGESVSYEASLMDKNNEERLFIFDHLPIIDESELSGIYIFGKEVTEKRAAEREIAAAQAELKDTLQLQKGLTIKFFKKDDRFYISLCEGSLLNRFGIAPEQLIGKAFLELFPENERKKLKSYFEEAWNGHFSQYESTINGITYYMSLQPVFKNGSVKEIIGSAADITELHEAQEQMKKNESLYRSVLSTMSEGLAVHDSSGEIITVNDKFAHFFGYTADGMKGKNFFSLECELYDEKGHLHSIEDFPSYQTAASGEAIHGKVMAMKPNNKPILWIAVNSEPLIKDESLIGCVVTINDITTQKLQELELVQSNNTMMSAMKEAERANKEKSLFLSKISHELRTPLNSIMGFSHMLMDRNDQIPLKQREWIDKIHKAGQHLLYLVNDITDLTKVEAGEIALTREHVSVYSLLYETLNMMKPISEKASLSLFSALNYVKEEAVYVDKARFKQIIFNLLSNAFKYNVENGTVIVFAFLEEGWIHIDVMDTGIGIREENLDTIFEPFVRLDTSFQEGSGIGLSLVKQYTELMGGKCSVSSKIGEGTTFRVSFPAIQ